MKKLGLFIILLAATLQGGAAGADSLSHWGYTLQAMPGRVLKMDSYSRKWMKRTPNFSMAVEASRVALPADSDAYAADYGYPAFSIGMRYTWNNRVRLHRDPDPDWGQAQPVDYDSRLGNTLSVYGKFYRAFVRRRHWETGYSLSGGLGYNRVKYDRHTNVDNELIGSHVLIYFGLGLHATYHLDNNWGIRGGIDFIHHSNGALYRPNKGSNTFGPSVGVVYEPYHKWLAGDGQTRSFQPFSPYFFLNFSAGLGAKTMLEDWLKTQFRTPEGDPDYRTGTFRVYPAYSLQADMMYRYARRWASGVGIDWFYGSYASHIAQLDAADGHVLKHSPWSLGVAAKHEVFYHRWSLGLSLGWYVHRQMGDNAKVNEARYYERIGVHYSIPRWGGMKVGVNVKAHKTKADLTELVIAWPVVVGGRQAATD